MYAALRLLSLILIVIALMLLGADVLTSLEKGGVITVRSIDQVWMTVYAAGDAGFKNWLNHAMPGVVAGAVGAVLRLPGWAVFGVLGVILAFLFGRRVADAD
ncbi:MAG TPA: hypothetical protein VIJ85_09540 [Rhizomicrobium sp.]